MVQQNPKCIQNIYIYIWPRKYDINGINTWSIKLNLSPLKSLYSNAHFNSYIISVSRRKQYPHLLGYEHNKVSNFLLKINEFQIAHNILSSQEFLELPWDLNISYKNANSNRWILRVHVNNFMHLVRFYRLSYRLPF